MFKTAFTYIIFTALGRSGAFVLLPLLTVNMSKDDFGYLSIFSNLMIFFTPLISMNGNITLSRNFNTDNKLIISHLQNNSIFVFIVAMVFALMAWLFIPVYGELIILSLMASLFGSFSALHLMKLQLNNNAKRFGILQLIGMIGNILITLLFFFLNELDYFTRACAIIVGLYLPFCREINNSIYRMSLKIINKKWIIEGFKLYPLSLMTWFLLYSDKLFMGKLHSVDEAGGYFLIYTLCLPLDLCLNGFGRVIYTSIYRNRENVKMQFKYIAIFSLITVSGSFLYVPIAKIGLEYFIDEKFHSDAKFIFPMVLYILLSHIASMIQTVLISTGDNINVSKFNLIAIMVYASLLFIFGTDKPINVPFCVVAGYSVLIFMLLAKVSYKTRCEEKLC
ncbi:hypothetical protein CSW98_08805 [Vibrio sp. HA2012]|uniref:lipopolysaccharide biosynthesis protein n=1 Tax=Vibrio sp. HA2012 TaxID=1971595 RepID=UPI000C2B6F51|nr:hypothetical protein [Vibrio sp. HA2012]PJC86308.1 hypothetical protein CSW98_08805 [Vibrio sp. HA2012]